MPDKGQLKRSLLACHPERLAFIGVPPVTSLGAVLLPRLLSLARPRENHLLLT